MEELKTLLGLLKDVPNAALIVLGGYLFYKLSVVASIYGTIKYVATMAFEAYKVKKTAKPPEALIDLNGTKLINKSVETQLKAQIIRLAKKDALYDYIHSSDIDWLREVLDRELPKRK